MEWMNKMNEALDYIEAHLKDEIDIKEITKIAHCSYYHFQKVFAYMANTSLAEYIRRRKLTLAAFDFQQSNDKVIDIALRYGYDSPTSFSRAFSSLHQMTPSEAKKANKSFLAYPAIHFQIAIKGGSKMNYRIEKKEAFRVCGLKITTTLKDQACYREIPNFWAETFQNGTFMSVVNKNNKEPFGVMGISVGDWNTSEQVDYYIAVSSNEKIEEGMSEIIIPACEWAIFECVGSMPDAIQSLQQRIYTEWLPTSGYKYADVADIELYIDEDQSKQDARSEVWFPIIKK